MARLGWLVSLLSVSAALLASPVQERDASLLSVLKPSGNGHWVDTWVTMPQLTEPANLPNAPFVSSPHPLPP